MFAMFPNAYASIFSGFYLAFMLVLVALIFRAVSLEFRAQIDSDAWRRFWDWAFGLGSLLAALLFGVAAGNLLRGVPIDAQGAYQGTFLGLLNPHSLLVGVMTLVGVTMHGALYMALKTEGELQARMGRTALRLWAVFAALYIAATATAFFVAPILFDSILAKPLFWVFFLAMLAGMAGVPLGLRGARYGRAFLGSCLAAAGIFGLIGVSYFPRMALSSIDPAYSLTIHNASSTPKTLGVMLAIALIALPFVLAYTAWIYWIFRGKAKAEAHGY
ncbi:MAG: Cytochrome bd-I ubiquinol oxidase subunit 2 [candidate division BRC1 bacterium ADurb.BinA364]|nr:MAG: Cytochrome bd-I ubiquinol oxidase subunit 2 [candidate division BRC1 bacterium ADurb.BinA364]